MSRYALKLDPFKISDAKELAEKWATALESGDYVQVRGALTSNVYGDDETLSTTGYCCIGVLGKICGDCGYGYRILNSLAELAEVDHDRYPMLEDKYIDLNDHLGHNFKQIAHQVRKDFLQTAE